MFLTAEMTYQNLPELLFEKLNPQLFSRPQIVFFNHPLAQNIGLADFDLNHATEAHWLSSGHSSLETAPIAMAYAGHQYGHFVPQLGDGRARLIAEVKNAEGNRFDLHLKGSGQTKYSRRGDGRATLGSVLREALMGEAFYHLGIPSSRALALTLSGEFVTREKPLPGAVLTRVAQSHIRVGTFEFLAARQEKQKLKQLLDYCMRRHDPQLSLDENGYLQFYKNIINRQASLVAKWLGVGFIHGVMNTDNMFISGETLDFGPCAFMDDFHSDRTYSSIDENGRYAFNQQPQIAQWNLLQLGFCLNSFFSEDEKKAEELMHLAVADFETIFKRHWSLLLAKKLGFFESNCSIKNDLQNVERLSGRLFNLMQTTQSDFTLTFRSLAGLLEEKNHHQHSLFKNSILNKATPDPDGLISNWIHDWIAALKLQSSNMAQVISCLNENNPSIIPRNHKVESIINVTSEAVRIKMQEYPNQIIPSEKLTPCFESFDQMMARLKKPFTDITNDPWAVPPEPYEVVHQTFCGT